MSNSYHSSEMLRCQLEQGVATLTLNRPQAANALSVSFAAEIADLIQRLAGDDAVKLVLLSASGKHFCAGAELSPELMKVDIEAFINETCKPLVLGLAEMDKPVISAVNGSAAGIGAAFALAADLCVMAGDAELFFSFSNINLVPDGGLSWMLQKQLGSKRAFQLIAEGGRLNATQCLEMGLCNKVVAADQLHASATEWAHQLVQRAPLSLRLSKRALTAAANGHSLAESISLEAGFQRQCQLSNDFGEAIRAFQEKRRPVFSGN